MSARFNQLPIVGSGPIQNSFRVSLPIPWSKRIGTLVAGKTELPWQKFDDKTLLLLRAGITISQLLNNNPIYSKISGLQRSLQQMLQ